MTEIIEEAAFSLAVNGFLNFKPIMSRSVTWAKWIAYISSGACLDCTSMHGKIVNKKSANVPPRHNMCRCGLEDLLSILSGTATIDKNAGADFSIKYYKKLPDNYLTKNEAEINGWIPSRGNLNDVLPNVLIGGDVYRNLSGALPNKPGRTWYEADINYTGGKRTGHRLLYSNDGLVFVTYDHYENFFEII